MKKLRIFKNYYAPVAGEPMEPKGIHHTVNYATSYEETWDHIKREVQNIYTMSANLTPEDRSIA